MAQTPTFNIGELLKQAQAIQQSFEANKEKLKQETATATVGGGMVTATVDGEKQVKEIKIAKELVEEGDVSAIEDLVVSAVNAANVEIDKKINANMTAFAGNALGGALGGLGGSGLGELGDMLGGLLGGGKK
ncbi:MAG: YbaB/EbfC family nucleoid-associated protein [Selenomonadaceae bacterium]|nr:YbaB/EbfC family nucleoid-associated protein [Selenomonadaceae bacterium]MBQ7629045.1 YbaB/EbfC family nucleoid-associated protein [Selenomonadaceae bacterium]